MGLFSIMDAVGLRSFGVLLLSSSRVSGYCIHISGMLYFVLDFSVI